MTDQNEEGLKTNAQANQPWVLRALAAITASLLVGLFIVLALITGGLVAGAGLHDPDTCWLLAMGRYMFAHGGLPSTDPFSYTFASQGQPYVVYQWLAELFFYATYICFQLPGLVTACGVALSITFIGAPLIIFKRLNAPIAVAFLLTILALPAASFHFLIRPEIFSYILLFGSVYVLADRRANWCKVSCEPKAYRAQFDWRLVLTLAAITLVWANMHTGFVTGLVILALLAVTESLQYFFEKRPNRAPLFDLLVTLLACLVVTLFNPKGFGLWAYLPKLFFSPINCYIQELKPLGLESFGEWTYYPFFALIAASLVILTVRMRRGRGKVVSGCEAISPPPHFSWFSLVIMALAIGCGFQVRRLIPFASILLICECAFLTRRNGPLADDDQRFLSTLERRFYDWFTPNLVNCAAIIGLVAALGSFIACDRIASPILPQGSLAFRAPFKAIEFLKSHPQSGKLLNEPQYGDMLIWYLPEKIPVFIDTRFDMYGPKLVRDFQIMYRCWDGFEKVLPSYPFDWAFLPRDSKLAVYLRSQSKENWSEIYKDEAASIFRRQASVLDSGKANQPVYDQSHSQ